MLKSNRQFFQFGRQKYLVLVSPTKDLNRWLEKIWGIQASKILVSSQIGNIPYYLQGGLWKKLNIGSLSALPDALGHLMMGTVIDITMFFNQNQLQQSQFGDL